MSYRNTFKRFEIKYILTTEQKDALMKQIEAYAEPDKYGKTTVCNIYLDTPNFRLIRRSLEKPLYKEKLRIRSYGTALAKGEVFVELKKKYKSVVYKRRLRLPQEEVVRAFSENVPLPQKSQIAEEIQYFREYYAPLSPTVYLSYDREAYYSPQQEDLRITFDKNIRYRLTDLSLNIPPSGRLILPEGMHLMEIKTAGAMPLWLVGTLSKNKIFKTSFSKYGNAYIDMKRSFQNEQRDF